MFRKGSKVEWKWQGGLVRGQVEEIHRERIERVIKGKKIVRNGSAERPAYVVRSEAGNLALKLETELAANSRRKREA